MQGAEYGNADSLRRWPGTEGAALSPGNHAGEI